MRRWATTSVAILSALASGVAFTTPAQATNFSGASGQSGCGGVNETDNRGTWVWYSNLTASTSGAFNWTRTNVYDPTIIDTHNEDVWTNQTDVVIFDDDYTGKTCANWTNPWIDDYAHAANHVIGWTECFYLNGANRCDQQYIYIDTDWILNTDATGRRFVAGHEFGHAVGLTHRSESNLMNADYNGTTTLSSHDIGHLNATNYPN